MINIIFDEKLNLNFFTLIKEYTTNKIEINMPNSKNN